jgi:hypothetical protein
VLQLLCCTKRWHWVHQVMQVLVSLDANLDICMTIIMWNAARSKLLYPFSCHLWMQSLTSFSIPMWWKFSVPTMSLMSRRILRMSFITSFTSSLSLRYAFLLFTPEGLI